MDADALALLELARPLVGKLPLGRKDFAAGTVGCALRTTSGRTFTGINLHIGCGIGFCAEHAAVAEMLKARETRVAMIVAVCDEGILPPCGRCRELLAQIDPGNFACRVLLPGNRSVFLRELLPDHWIAHAGP